MKEILEQKLKEADDLITKVEKSLNSFLAKPFKTGFL